MAKKRKASSNKATKKAGPKRIPDPFNESNQWPVAIAGGFRANPLVAVESPADYRWKPGTLVKAKKAKLAAQIDELKKPRKKGLTPAERKLLLKRCPRPADTRWPGEIVIGDRFREDMGDLKDLAREIDEVGAMLHRVPINLKDVLCAGERRVMAWQHTKFADLPMPVNVVPVKDVLRAEWSENYGRKPLTLTEELATIRALEPKERKRQQALVEARSSETKAAPGRAAKEGTAAGRVGDRLASYVGKDRRTMAKVAAVVDAAQAEPEKFGRLQQDMDRTGKVDGPFKRLQVMQQTDDLRKAPPGVPMQGPYDVVLIDFPVPAEDKEQDEIDAQGRSFRGYPEMSIKSCCAFAREKIRPILSENCSVWLCTTNWHLVRGYMHHIIAALGFEVAPLDGVPEDDAKGHPVTMLTWGKDKFGRGQVLRDQTEHVIVLKRGKPLVNIFGEDPPTTLLIAPRRENSRKPDELYRLIERVTPAKRYASIFSRGGEGDNWDCHGDEVGKFAPAVEEGTLPAPSAAAGEAESVKPLIEQLAMVEFGDSGLLSDVERDTLKRTGLAKGKHALKLTDEGKRTINNLREEFFHGQMLAVLEAIQRGEHSAIPPKYDLVRLHACKFTRGLRTPKITRAGIEKVAELRERFGTEDAPEALPSVPTERERAANDELAVLEAIEQLQGEPRVEPESNSTAIAAEAVDGPELPFGPVSQSCRVCDCTEDRACPGGCSWIERTLCSSCAASLKHVVSNTNDATHAIATCSCGEFKITAPWGDHRAHIDGGVKAHWQDVVAASGELPTKLRRRKGDERARA